MKLVVAVPYFRPRTGGVENYVLNLATRLLSLDWQVTVVTTGRGPSDTATVEEGLHVYRLPVALTVSNTPLGRHWRRRLAEIYRSERPDVINGHVPVPYLADLAERTSGPTPFVLTYHSDLHKDAVWGRAALAVVHRTVVDPTLRRSDAIIATSDYYVHESPHLRKYASKIKVVPPGVDLARFNVDVVVGDELAAAYQGRRVVLFVGSLNRSQGHKGLGVLIDAFARVRAESPDVSLVVVGGGDGLDHYRAFAAAGGVAGDVHFPGAVSDDELAQYYKLATVFAMASTDRSEGFGMVYAEAGAVGTPVIGARVGGVPSSVVDRETGLLVAPRSSDELYLALREVLDDRALASRLGAAGAARAKAAYDWQPLARRTDEILRAVAGGG